MNFNHLIAGLNVLLKEFDQDIRHRGGHPARQNVADAIFCLRQYVEPWTCPDCGTTAKVPADPKRPRHCGQCGRDRVFPYAYLEQERMDRQLKILLQCARWYSTQANGDVARKTLEQLHKG